MNPVHRAGLRLFTRNTPAARVLSVGVSLGDKTRRRQDEFRYATMRDPRGEGELAGDYGCDGPSSPIPYPRTGRSIGGCQHRSTVAKVKALGGSIVADAVDTPTTLATVTDPQGPVQARESNR